MEDTIKVKGEIEEYVIRAPKIPGWRLYHRYLPKGLRFWLANRFGYKEASQIVRNIVVNGALPVIAKRLGGITENALGYVAIGTGSTTPAYTDTSLEGEVYRVASSNDLMTTSKTNDTLQATASFSITGTYTIRKAGSFNSSSGGTLINEALLQTPRNVINGDTLVVKVRIQFTN